MKLDRVQRCVLVLDLTVEGVPLSVAGTHMAHILRYALDHELGLRRMERAGAPEALRER